MNVSKSCGPYSVPVAILIIIRDYTSDPLALLVNNSFTRGNFPDKLKLGRIPSIFKKDSIFNKDNWRPIYIRFNFSKITKKNYVLSPLQVFGRFYKIHFCLRRL